MDNNNQDSSKNVIETEKTDNVCDDIQKQRDILDLDSKVETEIDGIQEVAEAVIKEEKQIPRGYYDTPKDEFMQIDLIGVEYKSYPKVFISAVAHEKMRSLVKIARPNEITWLPSVDILEDNSVCITDIFVPGQECTEITTEVTLDGESILYSELITKKETNTIKKFLGWGHSHVEMPVYASPTDEKTTEKYIKTFTSKGKTHFVRLIANYFDDMYASIYLLKKGIVIHMADIEIEKSNEDLNFDDWAKEEIASKVKVKPEFVFNVKNILNVFFGDEENKADLDTQNERN